MKKILKSDATWKEALQHALNHAGQKVVVDNGYRKCWIDELGNIDDDEGSGKYTFSTDGEPFTLYEPEPEHSEDTELPRELKEEMKQISSSRIIETFALYHKFACSRFETKKGD